MSENVHKSKPYFPLSGGASDGYSNDKEATATCFCGAVQLAFPTQKPGLVDAFVCNCADCHKITASMYASNFCVQAAYMKHLRGQELLTQYAQSKTIASGNTMTNYFCSKCGTLMYRISSGAPDLYIPRIGTVDDFTLHETVLKPRHEQFVKDRNSWVKGSGEKDGMDQYENAWWP